MTSFELENMTFHNFTPVLVYYKWLSAHRYGLFCILSQSIAFLYNIGPPWSNFMNQKQAPTDPITERLYVGEQVISRGT